MIKTYYTLAKPGIIYGNLLAALAGFLFASRDHVNVVLLLATLLGIGLVIASACVFNNYIDRDIDKKMNRTQKRALAAGTISATSALVYATVLGLAGFGVLIAYTNPITVLLGGMAMVVYVVAYGYFKRHSVYGTEVGSIAGAVPPAAGYTAVTGQFDMAALLLFLILVFWQMPHFYAIAMYRYKEYKAAGLPVLPVKRGMKVTKVRILGYIVAFLVAIVSLVVSGYAGYAYLVVMSLLGVVWFVRGVRGFKTVDNEAWARGMFLFSMKVLLGFCIMLSVEAWLP